MQCSGVQHYYFFILKCLESLLPALQNSSTTSLIWQILFYYVCIHSEHKLQTRRLFPVLLQYIYLIKPVTSYNTATVYADFGQTWKVDSKVSLF